MARFGMRSAAATVACMATAAWMAFAQAPAAPAPAGPSRALPPAIATVGSRRISRAEFDQRSAGAFGEYRSHNGRDLPSEMVPVVRRQLLETLIRRELLVMEVERRGLLATPAEAEAQIRRDPYFQLEGRFNEAKFLAIKSTNPGAFAAALREMQLNLGARKLSEKLEAERRPSDLDLKGNLASALGKADIDYLALRRSDFLGTYPEPSESEILAAYQAHLSKYHRPDRATLSILFVDLSGDSAVGTRARSDRARLQADSVLAAVKQGATLETAGRTIGVPRTNIVVVPGNFPGYWRGSAQMNAAIFASRTGSVLPEPVPSTSGWLVVRVDEVQPAHVAPLRDVARNIRFEIRSDRRLHFDENELRGLYARLRDSLATTGYRVRYAIIDTARVLPGEPAAAELDRFYRAHLADYTVFDSQTGSITEKPLSDVRADVRSRWQSERRAELGRTLTDRLREAWNHGRRDAGLERSASVHDAGPVPLGQPIDAGELGLVLGDSLRQRDGAKGVGVAMTSTGAVVFNVYDIVRGYVPTFEQARPELFARRQALRDRVDEAAARREFDASPASFSGGEQIHYSRFIVPRPELLEVPLTRKEVERYFRDHIDEFSAPEMVRLSHILITPRGSGAMADREAHDRAEVLLRQIRAGEDFAALARVHTDDPATRESGGDLGLLKRDVLLPPVEKAAFEMRAGDVSELVKSDVGYHILKVFEYIPRVAQPLDQMYSNVGSRLAGERADTIAAGRADSLIAHLRNASDARAMARRLGYQMLTYAQARGERTTVTDFVLFLRALERTPAGGVVPVTQKIPGQGVAISWVDSISRPSAPTWETARDAAIAQYRRGDSQRALDAKRVELDSLFAAGWGFDSLGVLFGGLERSSGLVPGAGIAGVIQSDRLDTLLFGAGSGKPLEPNQLSTWVPLTGGAIRVRLAARSAPDTGLLSRELERQRTIELERRLSAYYAGLRARYPVRILDATLAQVTLPALPPPDPSR
jgi:parvulin-like peptidyl-prolyl isomerase